MSFVNESLRPTVKFDVTPEVLAIDCVAFGSVNVVPHQWYQNIRLESGAADLVSITLLSDIVYWYTPTRIRDEPTGLDVEVRKKFRADALQKTKEQLAIQFGFTERQVKESLARLENLGAITREFRTVKQPNGLVHGNVMFILIHPEVISELCQIRNMDPMTFKRHRVAEDSEDKNQKNPTPPMTLKRHRVDVKTSDITYTTQKTSSLDSLTEKVIIADDPVDPALQEKTPAAGNNNSSAKKKAEKKVYPCLKDLGIHEHTKQDITAKYTEKEVEQTAQLLAHKDSQYRDLGKDDASAIIQHALKQPWRYETHIANLGQPKLTKEQQRAKEEEIVRSDNEAKKIANEASVSRFEHGDFYNGYKCVKRRDVIAFYPPETDDPKSRFHVGSIEFTDKDFTKKLKALLKQIGL